MGEKLLNQLASFLWSTASAAARLTARPQDVGVRVISVGNIQVGGAGKTPIVAEIARQADARKLSVCILIRGYRGKWEHAGGVIPPGARSPSAQDCGDEAALLHDLAPRAWIGVGADRVARFEAVRASAGRIDLVLLDDGFQNHQMKKDLEIVALTRAKRSDKIFRDFDSALTGAGLVLLTKGRAELPAVHVPVARVDFKLRSSGKGARILLVTAVADGAAVFRSAQNAGYQIVRHECYPDHAPFDRAAIEAMTKEAAQRGLQIAVTGKDWVKWRELISPENPPIVLEPEVELDLESKKIWNRVIWGE